MLVASTSIGFTVMERYPAMKVVVAYGKASWMQEVLEKMDASTRVIPFCTLPKEAKTDGVGRWRTISTVQLPKLASFFRSLLAA
jgi:hypothetical protein